MSVTCTPNSAGVSWIIVAGAILDLAIQPLHTPSHGMRVVDVDVVVLPTDWLFHKRLFNLHACTGHSQASRIRSLLTLVI